MHFATRIWIRIAKLLALRNGRADHVVQPAKCSRSHEIVRVDDSMTDAWVRQQQRVRDAIARATPRSAPAKDAELDDEWVGPWVRQQRRIRDAIARATPSSAPAKEAELDDEWVGPWIRQQRRVRDAIAQATRRS